MQLLIGGLWYEANSFAPGLASYDDFRRGAILEGDQLLASEFEDELLGARRLAAREGAELVGLSYARAACGPPVDHETYERLRAELLGRVRDRVDGADGVFLSLHGAMVTDRLDDPEGDLVEDVRSVIGRRPLAISLDLHCHFTERMANAVDIAVGYETCPHVDFVETGERTMRLLVSAVRGDCAPRVLRRRVPLVTSAESHDTRVAPMAEVIAVARDVERLDAVLSASVFATQPWLDVPGLGWEVVVVVDDRHEAAHAHGLKALAKLERAIWTRRERFGVEKPTAAEAIARVVATPADRRPWVLADGGDSPSAGSSGDGATLLAALLEAGFSEPACVIVTDAEAARRCARVGVGEHVRVAVGGAVARDFFAPVELEGEVVGLTSGPYASIYPPGPTDAGQVAVLEVGSILVVVTEHPAMQLDRALYERAGIDLSTMRIVGVKSAGGYKAQYEPIAAGTIDIAGHGPSSSELTRLPYRRITRPLVPFDKLELSA